MGWTVAIGVDTHKDVHVAVALGLLHVLVTSRLACSASLKGCLDAEAVSEGVPGGRRAGRAGA